MSKLKPSDNGFPKLKKVKCFQCQQPFFVKFVIARQQYSQKNSWDYWTGEAKETKICNDCLKKLYYDKPTYWSVVKDLKKRNLLKSYLHVGHLA